MSQITHCRGITIIESGASYDSLDERLLEEFGGTLLGEATHADPPLLILDLTATGFIGSSFIELLVQAWKRLKQRKGSLILCNPQVFCMEVLRTARLDTIWPVFANRDEALAAAESMRGTG